MKTVSIFQGDTSPAWLVSHVDRAGAVQSLTSDYSCKITVSGTDISRTVASKTQDGKQFVAYLTPIETSALAPGEYMMGVRLWNTVLDPPVSREDQVKLIVKARVVTI